jgi:hypothetical protein
MSNKTRPLLPCREVIGGFCFDYLEILEKRVREKIGVEEI